MEMKGKYHLNINLLYEIDDMHLNPQMLFSSLDNIQACLCLLCSSAAEFVIFNKYFVVMLLSLLLHWL